MDSNILFVNGIKEVPLADFGIRNDGTSSEDTSAGLNKALQFAKEQGFSRVILPTGTYLIHENNPVVIDLKDTVIDLNGSTLQINTNGLEKYSIVELRDGAENVTLTNGIIRGDKDTHDYLTIQGGHEWGCGVIVKGGNNLQLDNLIVANVTGYGISIESGLTDRTNLFYTLYTKDVTQGSISEDGSMAESTTTTRTSRPYDISICGGQFELGYIYGYLGYPYLLNREYSAYFYDKHMKFMQKKECLQFRKVVIPEGAKYAHFVYPQANITGDRDYYAMISNFRPPVNSTITNCLIKENRCLGLAVCGGQQWIIENNVFEGNGGSAADHAVNFEDSFELIQDYVFRNNRFINNNNDLVVCGGDNLVFEGNELEKGAYFWERTTNYKVKGNKFNGGSVVYRIKRTSCEAEENRYVNVLLRTMALSSLTITLTNEDFLDTKIDVAPGTKFDNCTLRAIGNPYIKNAIMENCKFEIASADTSNLVVRNSKIKGAKWFLHKAEVYENCEITDSIFSTHGNTTKMQFTGCRFVDSQVRYNTWAASAETVIEQCQVTMTTNLPLVRLSAGKTRKLIFNNNTVVNETAKPVIELYDTTYTVPNGTAVLKANRIMITNYAYVFDGVNITQGTVNFTGRDNTITGGEMLNPKYVGNPHFVINP